MPGKSKDPSTAKGYQKAARKDVKLRRKMLAEVESLGPPVPELYLATVRAVGTPLKHTVVEPLREALARVNFHLFEIKLSDFLTDPDLLTADVVPQEGDTQGTRYSLLTDAGDLLRTSTKRADAVAMEGIRYLHYEGRRKARIEARVDGRRGVAYLFRNIMHPEEARRLFRMYGKQLFILGVYSPEVHRLNHFAVQLAAGDEMEKGLYLEHAQAFLRRETGRAHPTDELDKDLAEERRFLINIPNTYQHADIFLNISDFNRLGEQLDRFVHLIFRYPYHTPRPEEIGMAEAVLAATESSNLARVVGAAIVSPSGDILAMGTNDVPRPGGGVYTAGEEPDHRDHTAEWRRDPSDPNRRSILTNLVARLLADPEWLGTIDAAFPEQNVPGADLANWLMQPASDDPLETAKRVHRVNHQAITEVLINSALIRSSQFFDVIEYGRTLHAEMDAITSAARKGVSIKGATLYCTTLPCHECARLIIGSGIRRVLYIEPYEKSRAATLYSTEIRFTTMTDSLASDVGKVDFVPYMGVSPRRFTDLFQPEVRKRDDLPAVVRGKRRMDGATADWNATRETSSVRETIVSESAFGSVSRLFDKLVHEHHAIREYERDYRKNSKRSRVPGEGE